MLASNIVDKLNVFTVLAIDVITIYNIGCEEYKSMRFYI